MVGIDPILGFSPWFSYRSGAGIQSEFKYLICEPNKCYQASRVRSCLLIDPSASKGHSCGGRNPCYGPTYLMGEPNKCYKASHVRSCLLIDPSASKGHYCGGRESSQTSKL